MAPKAGSSTSASSSRLAARPASKPRKGRTPDPAAAAVNAVIDLYNLFHRGGTAYTFNDQTVRRFYCKACLNHEIQVVRAAREQFSKDANASIDVLRDIAMGRIEYFLPNKATLLDHVKNYCTYLTRETRTEINEISKILADEKKIAYKNQYDYGSLFEAVRFPKYADLKQDIQPGSASPARIFAAHEASLLERAQKRKNREVYNLKLKEKKAETTSRENTNISLPETPAYDSDDFDEAQRLENYNIDASKEEVRLNTSKMYDVDADNVEDDFELPSDFPSSDLLKALQSHAGDLYAKRGLMSTESKPKNEHGDNLPSMIQALDGSALIALGILAQELTKAQVVRPHVPQPLTDFYERTVRKKKGRGLYGYGKKQDNEVINRILEKLPEGSAVGLASEGSTAGAQRGAGTESAEGSDTEMEK